MHPFWAVRRITEKDLQRENTESGRHCTFNIGLEEKDFNVVTVGNMKGESCALTTTVTVPVMVNTRGLKKGEELLMEVVAHDPQKRKTSTWKDSLASKKPHTNSQPTVPKPNTAVAKEV